MIAALLICLAVDPAAAFLNWADGLAQRALQARDGEVAQVRTVPQALTRQKLVRQKVLALMGGLPEYTGPLRAQVTGVHRAEGYRIENVLFESLPEYWVTANLYLPADAGQHPGILFPLGHWDEGRVFAQQMAANLARKGFVVLAYDPMGQGERLQAYDPRTGKSALGGSTEQHFAAGAQALLLGQSFARYRIHDAKRALDYLISRPEVLPGKIGCTGCSGGGTVATYISALDDRIKVVVPSCYINSFKILFRGSVGDSEQSLPEFLSSGLDLTDWVELMAPKPVLITSTEQDFFTPAGAKVAFEEARHWFNVWRQPERVDWFVGPGPHGVPREVREQVYGWFQRWLNDGKGSAQEEDVKLFTPAELQVTKTGQVSADGLGKDLSSYLAQEYRRLHKPGSQAELRASLARWMGRAPAANSVSVSHAESDGLFQQQVRLTIDAGLDLDVTVLSPVGAKRIPAVVWVDYPGGADGAGKLARTGYVVARVSPRGAQLEQPWKLASGDWLANTRGWLVGQWLPALRARDLQQVVAMLAERPDVDSNHIEGRARGVPGIWLLLAAASEPRLRHITLDDTPDSFASAFQQTIVRNLHDAVLPGFALHWDLADVRALVGEERITWHPGSW